MADKTISLLAALSVFQQALKTTVISWDITANAMEEIAAEYCDRLLALDEAGLLFGTDPRKGLQAARDIAFKLTAGAGRRRSRFFTKGARTTSWSWRLMVVSSGEHSFGEMATKTGVERLGGEDVRVIDVPAVMSETWGVFHQVPPGKTSADLAAQVEASAQAHFGHPGRTFATALTIALEQDRSVVIAQINNLRAEVIAAAQVATTSSSQRSAKSPKEGSVSGLTSRASRRSCAGSWPSSAAPMIFLASMRARSRASLLQRPMTMRRCFPPRTRHWTIQALPPCLVTRTPKPGISASQRNACPVSGGEKSSTRRLVRRTRAMAHPRCNRRCKLSSGIYGHNAASPGMIREAVTG